MKKSVAFFYLAIFFFFLVTLPSPTKHHHSFLFPAILSSIVGLNDNLAKLEVWIYDQFLPSYLYEGSIRSIQLLKGGGGPRPDSKLLKELFMEVMKFRNFFLTDWQHVRSSNCNFYIF